MHNQTTFLISVKRAEETIMFGNQQNEAKEIKKRDNSDLADEQMDQAGEVIVNDPVDIQDEELVADSGDEEQVDETEGDLADSLMKADKETIEDAKQLVLGDDEDNTALASVGDDEQVGYQEYLKGLSKNRFK